jgi:pimeloyl-ACP methyl ester carboxylesterase
VNYVWRRVLGCLVVIAALPISTAAQTPKLVDIGGRSLEVVQLGSGSPTVVFETGLSASLSAWGSIPKMVADLSSVVSYSRAGQGASSPDPDLRTPQKIAEDLRALLQQVGAKPPYILVGHSIGGLYVRTFAGLYPSEVSGLVLLDGSHERQAIVAARLSPTGQAPAPTFQGAAAAEWAGLAETLRTGRLPSGPLPDVPMAVITSTQTGLGPGAEGKAAWRDLQAEIFRPTTYGMQIVTDRSSHLVPLDQPNMVVDAIEWVLNAVRSDAPRANGG